MPQRSLGREPGTLSMHLPDHACLRGAPQPACARTIARLLVLALAALATLLIAGCQTPPVAKELSRAQIATLESAQKAHVTYTAAVLEFAARSALKAEAEADASYAKLRASLLADLKDDPALLVTEIEAARKKRDDAVTQIRARVQLLRDSTEDLAQFWPHLLAAQRQLDTYLATPRPDQIVAGELLGVLKLNQTKLEAQAKTIADKLSTLTTP